MPLYYVMPLAESAEMRMKQATVNEKIGIIQEILAMLTGSVK